MFLSISSSSASDFFPSIWREPINIWIECHWPATNIRFIVVWEWTNASAHRDSIEVSIRNHTEYLDVVDDEDRDYFVRFVFGVCWWMQIALTETHRETNLGVKRARNCQRAQREMGLWWRRCDRCIENPTLSTLSHNIRRDRHVRPAPRDGLEQDKKCCIARVPSLYWTWFLWYNRHRRDLDSRNSLYLVHSRTASPSERTYQSKCEINPSLAAAHWCAF